MVGVAKRQANLREIVERVKPGAGSFILNSIGHGALVQYSRAAADADTGEMKLHRGRKWYISPFMTEDEIFRTLLLAVRTFEEHEVYENFYVDGKRYLDPHPEGGRREGQTSWGSIY